MNSLPTSAYLSFTYAEAYFDSSSIPFEYIGSYVDYLVRDHDNLLGYNNDPVLYKNIYNIAPSFNFLGENYYIPVATVCQLVSNSFLLSVVESILPSNTLVSNINYIGSGSSIKVINTSVSDGLGGSSRVWLSTGSGDPIGNSSIFLSYDNRLPGDSSLDLISGNPTFDATILEFDSLPIQILFNSNLFLHLKNTMNSFFHNTMMFLQFF